MFVRLLLGALLTVPHISGAEWSSSSTESSDLPELIRDSLYPPIPQPRVYSFKFNPNDDTYDSTPDEAKLLDNAEIQPHRFGDDGNQPIDSSLDETELELDNDNFPPQNEIDNNDESQPQIEEFEYQPFHNDFNDKPSSIIQNNDFDTNVLQNDGLLNTKQLYNNEIYGRVENYKRDDLDDFENFNNELNVYDSETNIEDSNGVEEEESTKFDEMTRQDVGSSEEDEEERKKRSSGTWEQTKSQRVKTGDTILNIRGAVRDAIGDGRGSPPSSRPGSPPSSRPAPASSRVDAFVIRPAASIPPPRNEEQIITKPQVVKKGREVIVEANGRARIQCDLANITNVRWLKDNEEVPLSASPSSDVGWREEHSLIVRGVRGAAGEWRCAGGGGKGEATAVVIYEPVRSVYLAVDGRRLDAGNTWVPLREKTVLEVRCIAEGGVPAPELNWKLQALDPALDHRPYLRIHPTNYSIPGVTSSLAVVQGARELHNCSLSCSASAPGRDAISAKIEIHVTYPPSFVISRWPGFGVGLWAGGGAALRCDVDSNPPAPPAWRADDIHSELVADSMTSSSATLRWSRLTSRHAGWYRCTASWMNTQYSSIGYYLNVLTPEEGTHRGTEPPPPPSEEPDHEKVEVPLGGNVQLHCPKGSIGCWWRRVVSNSSGAGWAPAGSHHAHGVLGIKEALYQEGGEYRCLGARAPDLQRLRELKRVTLKVTGGVTATAVSTTIFGAGWRLRCLVCGRGVRARWAGGGRVEAGRGEAGRVEAGRGDAGGGRGDTDARLTAADHRHCWNTEIYVTHVHEMWCVALSGTSSSVAVFPPRSPSPSPSPAPARHSARGEGRVHLLWKSLVGLVCMTLMM